MKKAAIIVNSKTGITRQYAEEIGDYLKSRGLDTQVSSIQTYNENQLSSVDYVFLGSWTNGLMVILQHPDKEWKSFAAKLPSMPATKLVLFTTYKIVTGSMFRNMYRQVKEKVSEPSLELKSRNGVLSASDKGKLDSIIRSF